jgi:hypothetical protein
LANYALRWTIGNSIPLWCQTDTPYPSFRNWWIKFET